MGEHYYKVLSSYRYLFYTIGLMGAASFINLYLTGVIKYAVLIGIALLALFLYRGEIRTLWTAAVQIVQSVLKRKKGGTA